MKKSLLFVILLSIFVFAGSVFANSHSPSGKKTYSYPTDKPVFSIDFPNTWKVVLNVSDIAISAQSPDNEIEYYIWAVPDKEVKEDVTTALNEAIKEINGLVGQYVNNPEFGDWTAEKVNEIDFLWAEGQGKSKDTDQTLYVMANFFSPDDKTIYVLMYWGTKEGEQKHKTDINAIDKSIKRIK